VTGNVLSQFVLFIRLSTAKTHYSVILYNGSSIGNHAPPFMLNSLFGRPYWEHFLNLQMICITDILKLQTWLEFIIPRHAILAPRMLRTNVCMSIPVTGRLHKPVFIKMAKKFITQTTQHDSLKFHFLGAKELGREPKTPTWSLPIAAPMWRREIRDFRRIICHIYVSKMVQARRIVSMNVMCAVSTGDIADNSE